MNEGEQELEAVQQDLETQNANATFVSGADGRVRQVVYCDHLGTGQPVPAVERAVATTVHAFHANAHSASSSAFCARRAAALLAEARALVRGAVRAREDDAVLFCGAGATAAANKLARVLGARAARAGHRLVVLVDAAAHHSALLPWRTLPSAVLDTVVPVVPTHAALEAALAVWAPRVRADRTLRLVGALTVASNVTGVARSPTALAAATRALHRAGALAVWDATAAAPHLALDMHPPAQGRVDAPSGSASSGNAPTGDVDAPWDVDASSGDMDAVFFSGHKWLGGGGGAPGVLVARETLFDAARPESPGGGTVLFVDAHEHVYHRTAEQREEAGSPDLAAAVRLGLCVRLRDTIGTATIAHRVAHITDIIHTYDWGDARKSILFFPDESDGEKLNTDVDKVNKELNSSSSEETTTTALPVLTFVIWCGPLGRFLHHDFVCAVLNDLFGVQARGGCLCAGPHVWALLGIAPAAVARLRAALVDTQHALGSLLARERDRRGLGVEAYRPGLVRVSLHWAMRDADVRFVLAAVACVAQHSWRLLPAYELAAHTGTWRARTHWKAADDANRVWLGHFSVRSELKKQEKEGEEESQKKEEVPLTREECFEQAGALCEACERDLRSHRLHVPEFHDEEVAGVDVRELRDLRWFATPFDSAQYLIKGVAPAPQTPLFCAQRLRKAGFVDGVQVPEGEEENNDDDEEKDEEKEEKKEEEKDDEDTEQKQKETEEEMCLPFMGEEGPEDEEEEEEQKNERRGFVTPPKKLFKDVLEGLATFGMIRDGDRVLACISGGKDSLTMLHVLAWYQHQCAHAVPPLRFELGAATVDPQEPSFRPQPLAAYMAALGVPYTVRSEAVMACARRVQPDSFCSFCSRVKRGLLYSVAREHGYNVLALGQHLDDACESFLMSTFRNGFLRTMKANYTVTEGDLRVIRPLM